MKVRFVSGPRAGQTTHVQRDRFSDLLLQAGVLELVEEDQPRVPTPDRSVPMHNVPKWGLKTDLEGNVIAIQADWMRGTYFYNGSPEGAARFEVGNFTVPQEVSDAYIQRRVVDPAWALECEQEKRRHEAADLSAGRFGADRPRE